MQPFDHVSVLMSFVISLAVAHYLTGIANMVRHGVRRVNWFFLQWFATGLFMCVDFWFSIWRLHDKTEWSLQYVLLLLALASAVYIPSRLLTPEPTGEGPIDLTAYYERNRRRIIGTLIPYIFIGEATNLTLPGFAVSTVFLVGIGNLVALGVAWLTANRWAQGLAAAANFALLVYYSIYFLPAL